jgi:hypothetical protein
VRSASPGFDIDDEGEELVAAERHAPEGLET